MSATSGGNQAVINTAFTNLLVATVTDGFFPSIPLANIAVVFAAPGSGASVTFTGGDATATTNTQGHASIGVTANGTLGSETVTAGVSGVVGSASFA